MTLIVAAAEPSWAFIAVDTRAPAQGEGWSDTFQKLIPLRDGWAAATGQDLGYGALHGASLDELGARLALIHDSGTRALRASLSAEALARLEAASERAEDPDARGDPWYAKVVAVGRSGPVLELDTSGTILEGGIAFTLPPGVPSVVQGRLLAAFRAPDPYHGSGGDSWPVILRAAARLAALAAQESPWVGPILDVGLVDREAGELRSCRQPSSWLAEATDADLEETVTRDGLVRRLVRRMASRGQARVRRSALARLEKHARRGA